MKWNKYTQIISSTVSFFLFNALHKTCIEFDVRLCSLFDNLDELQNTHPEFYEQLVKSMFIIPDNYDEVTTCIALKSQELLSNKSLRITINPTLDCNLRCWYCYESHLKGSVMDSDTIKRTLDFIEKRLKSQHLTCLQLSFFGGEPLLKYNKVIKEIIYKAKELCERFNTSFQLAFTTNGVCLSSKIEDDLISLTNHVSIQVAFDGGKDAHNNVKHFPNGKGCYDIVLKNLTYAIDHGVLTTIRCNYTNESILSFRGLMDDFRFAWKRDNFRFSFHKVWQEIESESLQEKREKIKTYVGASNVKSNINSNLVDSLYPCCFDYDHNILINYNGDIFKCTARDFKPEHRIGYLSHYGEIIYNDNLHLDFKSSLTTDCFDCKLLPICTICLQQRREAKNHCPYPETKVHAEANIEKYFHYCPVKVDK